MKIPVTVMVFTLNEEANLPSCLESLGFSDDVIVVDSFSADATESIARAAGARFFQNRFTGFGDQRNWAMDHASPKNEWVLVLDADERVPEALAREIAEAVRTAPDAVAAFRLKRRFHLFGRWLRHSSLYPTWVVRLVRRGRVRYVNRGHAETQEVSGLVAPLENDLIDENRKGLDAWYERQRRYAKKEAEYELSPETAPAGDGPLARRAALKRLAANLPFRPALYFLYSYVWRRGFLDGAAGLRFCLMKAEFQGMIVDEKKKMRAAR